MVTQERALKRGSKARQSLRVDFESLRDEFIPQASSGLFVKILKKFNKLKKEEKKEFLNSLRKLEEETSPIFLIDTIIRLNGKNMNPKLMKNSLELISFFYNDLSDEIQKKSVFYSLDEIDKEGFVTNAALSLVSEADFETFLFLSYYLYRGDKMLSSEKKKVLNKEALKRFEKASSPSELISLFNILSTYQIVSKSFREVAYSHLSSDEYSGKAAAIYLITSSTRLDAIIAAAVNKEAAREKALCSENGYEVAAMQFTNLKEDEKKKVIKELKKILESWDDEMAKRNINQFFSDLKRYIKEKHLLSVLSEAEKLVFKQEPYIKGAVWKMRMQLMDSIKDIFNSKVSSSKFSKLEKIMKEMQFEQSEIKNFKNLIKEEIENSTREISSLGI